MLYAAPALTQVLELSQIYFEYERFVSAAYAVIFIFDACVALVGVALTVGLVVSKIIPSLIVAVLRFPAASLYFTYTIFPPSPALHHDPFTIFHVLLVAYVSAALHVL